MILELIIAGHLATVEVISGDTLLLNGRRWWLLGFETPRVEEALCSSERKAGEAARARLEALIKSAKDVRVIPWNLVRDRYRQYRGWLYLDGKDVAKDLIAEGLARKAKRDADRTGWCPS